MMDRSKYKYIYNASFANYLILNGVICRGTGVNKHTGGIFWCFNYDECQPVYEKLDAKSDG